ncbi:MAG: flagellar motor protein MotB [Armatimonadota bacterium]|nr:flagellar motor protein MotB [Armatimonadota bacterium]
MAEEKANIRIVKRKKTHAGHHGGAWKVAYADFVTAMMAFFLVMWITGMSQEVKAAIAGYFKNPEAFMQEVKAGNALFKITDAQAGSISNRTKASYDADERKVLQGAKERIVKMVSSDPEFKKMKDFVDIKLVDEGLRIDLLDDKESLFFDSGSAAIKPTTRHLLALMTAELRGLPNNIIISGHTDSRPLSSRYGYTNWELSSNRANAARQVMDAAGLQENQVAQVRGYAATDPRDPKHPEHYSNRRVSITVVLKSVMEEKKFGLLNNGGGGKTAERQEYKGVSIGN